MAAPKLNRITVAEAVDLYLRQIQRAVAGASLSETTAANYARDLAEFVDLAGADTILDDLTAADVDELILAYGAKPDGRFKPETAGPGRPVKRRGAGAQARFRQSVSRLFSEAVLAGWVEASPMPRTVVRPKARTLKNVSRRALPEPSALALRDVPASVTARVDQQLTLRDEFLLRLFMESGPRVSEVSRADRADLGQRADGTWWLRVYGKGAKERWLPMSQTTAEVYEKYVANERPRAQARTRVDPESGLRVETAGVDDAERALVLTWRGLRMLPRDMQLMVGRHSGRLPADVRRAVTPHGLRHTAATLLLNSGAASVKTVKEILGHESIATTGIYLDTEDFEMSAAVAAHPVTGDHPLTG